MKQNNTMQNTRGTAKRAYVYCGFSRRNHNILCSVDPLFQHSKSWRDLQSRSAAGPQQRPGEWLDYLGFVGLLAFILFVFLFLPALLGS